MNVEKEITRIKERNKRVEADKAWELSNIRKALIALTTYVIIVIFLLIIEAPEPLLTAVVPVIAFILSTATIEAVKKYWVKKYLKARK